MTEPKDKWRGRQLYPKDTVSQKKLDAVDDRSNRRIDLLKVKVNDLQAKLGGLELEIRAWSAAVRKLAGEEKE